MKEKDTSYSYPTANDVILSAQCTLETGSDTSRGQTKRQTRIGSPRGNGRPHSQGCHRSYAPYLQALFLFARAIVNIGDFYYCIVLTILNVIPNGITCIYEIIELNKKYK